jgi:hypothetical protein
LVIVLVSCSIDIHNSLVLHSLNVSINELEHLEVSGVGWSEVEPSTMELN